MPLVTGHSADDRLTNELGEAMRNEQVDAAFRGILAGVSPKVPEEKRMDAANKNSQETIEQVASVLCRNAAEVRLLQMVHELGKIDGRAEAVLDTLKRFTV